MPFITLEAMGRIGFAPDAVPTSVPPQALTSVVNFVFREGSITRVIASTQFASLSVAPTFIMDASTPTAVQFVAASLTRAFGLSGSATADITRSVGGDYTGSAVDYWNGCVFNSIPCLTNGVDVPQVWNPPSLSQRLVDMPNWPSNTRARVLRAFKTFLVALDVTVGTSRNPRLVKWSHSAASGLPTTWDITDPTKDAGESTLPQGSDKIVDALELGDALVIYCEGSTWTMRFVGAPLVFSFQQVFTQLGALCLGACAQFPGGHLVVTSDDIVVHDLNSIRSIADGAVRRWLFNNINVDAYSTVRVVTRTSQKEVWILFPYGSASLPNRALVWNWSSGVFTLLEVPYTISATRIPSSFTQVDPWDSDSQQWDSDSQSWDTAVAGRYKGEILLADNAGNAIRQYFDQPSNTSFNGTVYEASFQRDLLCHFPTREGTFVPQRSPVKLLLAIRLHTRGLKPPGVYVKIGSRMREDEPIDWGEERLYDPGVSFLEYVKVGRFFTLNIRDLTGYQWWLDAIELEIVPTGEL